MSVKVRGKRTDINAMASTNCAACGSGLNNPEARFCSTCGAAVVTTLPASDTPPVPDHIEIPDPEALAEPETSIPVGEETAHGDAASKYDGPPRRTMTEDQWQYATWGAVAASAVAVVALIAVVFGLLSRAEDASAASNQRTGMTSTTTTTIQIADGPTAAAPVTEPVMIEAPRVGQPVWYRVGRTAVIVTLTMSECDRIDGMLRASGEIRNSSPIGQTLDYRFGVEMTRPVVGTALASLEATVDDLAAGETIEWLVETPSTKSVSLQCDIGALTVAPAPGR